MMHYDYAFLCPVRSKGPYTCKMPTLPETQLGHTPVLGTFTNHGVMHTDYSCSYDKGMSIAISSRGILTPYFRLNM